MFDVLAFILMLFTSQYLQPGNTWTYVFEPEHSLRIMEVVEEKKIDGESFFLIRDSAMSRPTLVRKAPGYLEVKNPHRLDRPGERFPLVREGPIPFFFFPDFIIETKNVHSAELATPAGSFQECMVFDIFIKSRNASPDEKAKFEGTIWYKRGIGVVKIEGPLFRQKPVSLVLSSYHVKKLTLAVLDLDEVGTVSGLGKTIAEALRTFWIKSGEYSIVERVMIQKVLNEQALNMTGLVDDGRIAKVGKLLGSEKVLVGSVSKLSNGFMVNLRFVDVETGLSNHAQTVIADNEKDLLKKLTANETIK